MKPKTLAYLLLGFLAFFALSWLFYTNRAMMGERFIVWPGRFVPLYMVVFIAFSTGLALMLIVNLVRESRHFMARWRDNRTRREVQAVDELYASGVEAMLDGRPASALEHFRTVLSRTPRRADVLIKAGEVLRTLGRLEEATELHMRAHKSDPEDLGPLYELVADADAREDTAATKHYLEEIIRLKPQEALNAYRRLRDILILEEDWNRALETQEQVDKIRPEDSVEQEEDRRFRLGIRYEIGARLQKEGRGKEAVAQLRRLLKDAPSFVPAWRLLGLVRRGLGDDEGSVAIWLEGYEATQAPVLLTMLEDHFLGQEQPERAIEVFRQAIGSSPTDTVPRFYLGKLFYRLEMLDEAMVELSALRDRAAYTPTLSYYLARIHERRGRYAEANSHYRKIIREGHLLSSQFRCLVCGRDFDAWVERCQQCGEWNTVEVDFKEDVTLEELGISTAPVYTAPHS